MSDESLTSMDKDRFIYHEHARGAAFNIFTALLCQPEEEWTNKSDAFDTLRSALEIVSPDCVPQVDFMLEALQQLTVQELLVEYTRLFIGPFKTAVPPYSSLYFGTDQVMDDTTIWVINCYKRSGLEYDYDMKDVPDHVTVETEFMYYLIHSEINALDAGDRQVALGHWESQQTFYTQHYKKWIPQFCAKIAAETENAYYLALSDCLSKFVSHIEIPPFPQE